MSSIVTCTAVLDVNAATVTYVVGLLNDLHLRLGTWAGTRTLTCWQRAVLVPWVRTFGLVPELFRSGQCVEDCLFVGGNGGCEGWLGALTAMVADRSGLSWRTMLPMASPVRFWASRDTA